MIATRSGGNVFIVNTDSATARSQMKLLEVSASDLNIQHMGDRVEDQMFGTKDIVVIDLNADEPTSFATLDSLLRVRHCPKLLITVFDTQIFQPDDRLGRAVFKILFKPFLPKDMISAVKNLHVA